MGLLGLSSRGSWEAPGGGEEAATAAAQPRASLAVVAPRPPCFHSLQPRHRPAPGHQLVGGRKTGGETGETLVAVAGQRRRAGTQSSPDYSPLQ